MDEEKWDPSDEAYDCVVKDKDKVDFIYKTVQDKLQSTIDSHSFLDKKIILFLSYIISINTIVIGYMVSKYDNKLFTFYNYATSYWQFIAIIIIFTYMIIKSASLLKANNFYFKGNDLQNLFKLKYCSFDCNAMILGEAILYKERIDHNMGIIDNNTKTFNLFLILSIILPIIILFIVMLFTLFS